MRILRMRFSMRRMMAVVAVIGAANWLALYGYDDDTSILEVGQVILIEDDDSSPQGMAHLEPGTRARVVVEPAVDADDESSGREVGILVEDGPRRGERVSVKRRNLRVPLRGLTARRVTAVVAITGLALLGWGLYERMHRLQS